MKPIACVKCQRFLRPKKNGYYFLEGMPSVNHALPGIARSEHWTAYKLWSGDLWECAGCGAQMILPASSPISEHYLPDFKEKVRDFPPNTQINDC